MIKPYMTKKQIRDHARRIQKQFNKRLEKALLGKGGLRQMMYDAVVGAVNSSRVSITAEEMAGNWEWNNDYDSPHRFGGPPSIAVREAILIDARHSPAGAKSKRAAQDSIKIDVGIGNVDLLNDLSPHWIYYELGSGHSYAPDDVVTDEAGNAARGAYTPSFQMGGTNKRKMRRGNQVVYVEYEVNYIWFSDEAHGTRREGALRSAEEIESSEALALSLVWETGTPGRHIYRRASRQMKNAVKKMVDKEVLGSR
jgi:hypothetical protein